MITNQLQKDMTNDQIWVRNISSTTCSGNWSVAQKQDHDEVLDQLCWSGNSAQLCDWASCVGFWLIVARWRWPMRRWAKTKKRITRTLDKNDDINKTTTKAMTISKAATPSRTKSRSTSKATTIIVTNKTCENSIYRWMIWSKDSSREKKGAKGDLVDCLQKSLF